MTGGLGVMRRSLDAFYARLATATPESVAVGRPGVRAYVTPRVPGLSLVNAITYDDPGALHEALPELAEVYRGAGVRAWTVWTMPGDAEAEAACAAAGHVLDATPEAMALDLEGAPPPPQLGLDLSRPADAGAISALNERAYGIPPGAMAPGWVGLADPHMRRYLATRAGEPVATCVICDEGEDASVWAVATAPGHGRRGHAGRLMALAVSEARQRGRGVSTLQATAKGRGLYERLGYRSLGTLGMWERREPAPGPA